MRPREDEDLEETPEWLMVLFFDQSLSARLWRVLQAMPESEFMPSITNDGANCSLFRNKQNRTGFARKWSAHNSAPHQEDRHHPWLPSDVMCTAFGDYGHRNRSNDKTLSNSLTGKDQFLFRPPQYGRNLQGDSTCSAYAEIDGAAFLEGYRVMRGL
jgi:hypothetical protein